MPDSRTVLQGVSHVFAVGHLGWCITDVNKNRDLPTISHS